MNKSTKLLDFLEEEDSTVDIEEVSQLDEFNIGMGINVALETTLLGMLLLAAKKCHAMASNGELVFSFSKETDLKEFIASAKSKALKYPAKFISKGPLKVAVLFTEKLGK